MVRSGLIVEEGRCELSLCLANGKTVAYCCGKLAADQPHFFLSFLWLTLGQKATEAKEQWKELKAVYQGHVEAIKCGLSQALPKFEEIQRKYKELKAALGKLQAKVHLERRD